ncbi:ATG8-interacting protein 1-like [Typha angustifolia]|uniref:ATG8-interacting protein 1-like n=1 Tax=Typha angustifolia TaxID=59011 RepID=UPI003C305551
MSDLLGVRLSNMSDYSKNGEETSIPGTDWEVVSLTASTYATAPGPKRFEASVESSDTQYASKGHESSDTMFLSGHFSLPCNGLANLLKETDCKGTQNELCDEDEITAEAGQDQPKETYGENCKTKSYGDLDGVQSFVSGKNLTLIDKEFGNSNTLQRLNLVREEPVMFISSGLDSLHAETKKVNILVNCTRSGDTLKADDPYYQSPDSLVGAANPSDLKENKIEGSSLACEAWWKRQMVLLYNNVKETNMFWSVSVAAALMGLAIIGQRWQRQNLLLQQLKMQFSVNNEAESIP